jgi:hypothetical protein
MEHWNMLIRNRCKIVIAAIAGGGGLLVSDNVWTATSPTIFVTQAEARIGRPLTPVSVAGVARRTSRRTVVAGAVAGGAIGYGYGYGRGYGYSDPYGYESNYTNGYAPSYSYANGDPSYCVQRFRSYDPSTGTYLGYDGRRHPCP